MSNCSGCNAPVGPSALACEYCGKVLREPANSDEEVSLVRQQAEAAQKVAMSERFSSGEERYSARATWWRTAYLPRTVPGMAAQLDTIVATMPSSRENEKAARMVREHSTLPLLEAMLARLELLETRLRMDAGESSREATSASTARAECEKRLDLAEKGHQRVDEVVEYAREKKSLEGAAGGVGCGVAVGVLAIAVALWGVFQAETPGQRELWYPVAGVGIAVVLVALGVRRVLQPKKPAGST